MDVIIIAMRRQISCTFNGDLIEFMQRECGREMLVFPLIKSFAIITCTTISASRVRNNPRVINSRNELISVPAGEALMHEALNSNVKALGRPGDDDSMISGSE